MEPSVQPDSFQASSVQDTHVSWVVENFSLRCQNQGECIESPTFPNLSGIEYDWRFKIHSHGTEPNHRRYISFFLHFNSQVVTCALSEYKVMFYNKNRDFLTSLEASFQEKSRDTTWGCIQCVERNELLGGLKDNVLIIECNLKWEIDSVRKTNNWSILHVHDFLSSNLKKIMNENKFSDVTLKASDETKFPANKCLLAACSPVFAAMFEHDMRENVESQVQIQDLDARTIDSMLKFIYFGEFNANKAESLFTAADKYDIDTLKKICIQELCTQLNLDNAVNCLLLAIRHNEEDLLRAAKAFITVNFKEMIQSDRLQNFSRTQPRLFFEIMEVATGMV